jgi:hypothetical protein
MVSIGGAFAAAPILFPVFGHCQTLTMMRAGESGLSQHFDQVAGYQLHRKSRGLCRCRDGTKKKASRWKRKAFLNHGYSNPTISAPPATEDRQEAETADGSRSGLWNGIVIVDHGHIA